MAVGELSPRSTFTAFSRREEAPLELALLKGFELTCAGARVGLPLSAQRLMAFLALNERPLLRVYVAGALWTDSSEIHSSGSLRSALWRLQRPGHQLVEVLGDHICLTRKVRVDVRRVEVVARELIADAQLPSVEDFTVLASGGELLPGWYDDWILVERERIRQLRLHALEALCVRLTERRRWSEAIMAGLAAVEGEPLRESAHRTLIQAYLAEGNGGEAVRQYRLCESVLQKELGIRPSESITTLVADLVH
jgi:DNA-binding SARP family transcriptional activator